MPRVEKPAPERGQREGQTPGRDGGGIWEGCLQAGAGALAAVTVLPQEGGLAWEVVPMHTLPGGRW